MTLPFVRNILASPVPFGDDASDTMEISNLDILNLGSYDYHMARMLGLGFLDTETEVLTDSYVYIAEYESDGDLEDGLGDRVVHHLAMTLPTSTSDERLPLPIDLQEIIPGAFFGNEGEPSAITDEDGYTHDGTARYVSLFNELLAENQISTPFFTTPYNFEFSAHLNTKPIYAGLEYKLNSETGWRKPEIANTSEYQNKVPQGEDEHNETRPLIIPETGLPLYVHKHTVSGIHIYKSYGINWFSRAALSESEVSIETNLESVNLEAPNNVAPFLIREEIPPLLTSIHEQTRLSQISGDKTLIRLTFDYNTHHELLNYKVPLDSGLSDSDLVDTQNVNDPQILYPDNEEILAEEVEIFFRSSAPDNIEGKALNVTPHANNELLSVIETGDYFIPSTGETIEPIIQTGTEGNYIGGTFILGEQEFIIQDVVQGTEGPVFTVYKKEISDTLITSQIPNTDVDNLQAPEIAGDGHFMAIENMQNESSWGSPNPIPLNVTIGNSWSIHREVLHISNDDGDVERQVEKTRGIWYENATIEEVLEPAADLLNGELQYDGNGNVITEDLHQGSYKITVPGETLANHPQYDQVSQSVQWYKGIVRAFTVDSIQGSVPVQSRKVFRVDKIENIGSSNDIVIYVRDTEFSDDADYDPIQIGSGISVNFYPGYRVYLYNDDNHDLKEEEILPQGEQDVKYSVFGLRSHATHNSQDYYSRIGVPALMFAQKLIEAETPEQPLGPLYATRPDFFGRSSYTFTTTYTHEPRGVLFYRTNEAALLSVLYKKSTIENIRAELESMGGNNEEFFTNRWQNFLDFNALATNGDYLEYPPEADPSDQYKFPNPDKPEFFDWLNGIKETLNESTISESAEGTIPAGDIQILEFVKGAIYSAFVSLTEVPIVYSEIEDDPDYVPLDKKQNIRSRNGHVLSPSDSEFLMAPMMKIIGDDPDETQFTDFTLDGTSDNIYFYGVKELGSQMKMSDFSPFLGPVKLVNTSAADAPAIRKVTPILENSSETPAPAVRFEINAYPPVQNIRSISIYRAFDKLSAQSIRSMQFVNAFEITEAEISDAAWQVKDDFGDLLEVPYGDALYYRIVVGRKVEYRDKNNDLQVEYAPSHPSKITATVVVEVYRPAEPELQYASVPINAQGELHQVQLYWDKTCYKGKYHVYKMNSKGNWFKIHELVSNDEIIYLPLANTELQTGLIETEDANGNAIYHHFKVVAENTSGLLSSGENILTIHNPDNWTDLDDL
jgi:hypothetical protein